MNQKEISKLWEKHLENCTQCQFAEAWNKTVSDLCKEGQSLWSKFVYSIYH